MTDAEVVADYVAQTPLGRIAGARGRRGVPSCFLCRATARFMTGEAHQCHRRRADGLTARWQRLAKIDRPAHHPRRLLSCDPAAAAVAAARSLTDKLTAYKIPPEFDHARPRQLRRDLHRLSLRQLFPEQRHRRGRFDRDRAAAGDGDGLRLRALQHRWRCRCGSSCCPARCCRPIMLVLPLFALFLMAGLLSTLGGADHRASDHQHARFWPGCWSPSSRATWRARAGGTDRRRHAACRPFVCVAVPVAAPGILAAGLLGLHPELERVPVCADPSAGRRRTRCRSACPRSRPSAASRSRSCGARHVVALLPVFVLLPFMRAI